MFDLAKSLASQSSQKPEDTGAKASVDIPAVSRSFKGWYAPWLHHPTTIQSDYHIVGGPEGAFDAVQLMDMSNTARGGASASFDPAVLARANGQLTQGLFQGVHGSVQPALCGVAAGRLAVGVAAAKLTVEVLQSTHVQQPQASKQVNPGGRSVHYDGLKFDMTGVGEQAALPLPDDMKSDARTPDLELVDQDVSDRQFASVTQG